MRILDACKKSVAFNTVGETCLVFKNIGTFRMIVKFTCRMYFIDNRFLIEFLFVSG